VTLVVSVDVLDDIETGGAARANGAPWILNCAVGCITPRNCPMPPPASCAQGLELVVMAQLTGSKVVHYTAYDCKIVSMLLISSSIDS
jgi:hypothetical protein